MKELNGRELVGDIKEGQARRVRQLKAKHITPKLAILYDSDNPVIAKYMEIDCEGLDIQITTTESDGGNGNVPALVANIPIKEVRH